MAISSPSTKLLAVVHVGLLSGVVQTRQQEPLNNEYELHGAAVDVCCQIMTETLTSSMTEQYQIMVTQDAVDDDGGEGFESLKLVPASPCYTVGNSNLCSYHSVVNNKCEKKVEITSVPSNLRREHPRIRAFKYAWLLPVT